MGNISYRCNETLVCCSRLGFTSRFFSSRLLLFLKSLLAVDVVKVVDLSLGSVPSFGLENRYCLEGDCFKMDDSIISGASINRKVLLLATPQNFVNSW